jgi:outer membrane protein OmpA-like peptidoglycan-associated protein
MFLNKRVADCKYALEHPEVAPVEEQEIKNVGNGINTSNPEYGAVYTRGKLVFTSKRKDDDKEKKNGIDGRYFDAMYVSTEKNGSLSAPRRFTVPDVKLNSNFSQPHESVVSVSPDGNTLYIFREGQIYETDLNDSTKSAHKLSKEINFSYLQSHLTLSADGNTMIFAAEADRGMGGLDLYRSTKDEKGNWQDATLLSSLSTIYNEDSPYLNKHGVLFFSSNGLPGYGGYDVYKSRYENNQWMEPVNLGQPINSPGDDIYFSLIGNTSNGYYTSVRQGGYGDMDIYKVHYVLTDVPQCQSADSSFAINAEADPSNAMVYNVSASAPAQYTSKIRSYTWKVNGETLAQNTDKFQHTFATSGSYTLSAKAVAYCDTCPSLVALCSEKVLEIGTPMFANTDSLNKQNDLAANTKTNTIKGKKTQPSKKATVRDEQVLNEAQLAELGWNNSESYFDYNRSDIRQDAMAQLNQNIKVLKKNKDLAVNINGHADSRGTDAYNQNLSVKRANAVKNYLLENGIAQNRILSVKGFGETKLVNDCADGVECSEPEHQLNRRSEFEVINLIKTPSDISFN